jgi:ABC-type bacteriocin/lantibiotic exporter with double-glycine peptidase domain
MKDVPVTPYRQQRSWSCGAAALKIVLSRFGKDVSEDNLIDLSATDPQGGTRHEGMVAAARALGYKIYVREDAGEDDLVEFLRLGLPVIVDFQARSGGHYAVVTAVDNGRVHIEDPRREGSQHHTLDLRIFLSRWFNVTYGDRRFVNRWMLVLLP